MPSPRKVKPFAFVCSSNQAPCSPEMVFDFESGYLFRRNAAGLYASAAQTIAVC
jgi:hypothetical protein